MAITKVVVEVVATTKAEETEEDSVEEVMAVEMAVREEAMEADSSHKDPRYSKVKLASPQIFFQTILSSL